jgi:hypothetical protein
LEVAEQEGHADGVPCPEQQQPPCWQTSVLAQPQAAPDRPSAGIGTPNAAAK